MKLYTDIDLRYNEVQNINIQTDRPDTPTEGTIYYNKTINRIQYYNGTQWISIGAEEGGGGGDINILEQVYVNGQNLRVDSSKAVKLNFTSLGDGKLIIKDVNKNSNIATVSIGGNSGIKAEDLIAVGILSSGKKTYTIEHSLGTDSVLVQVIDSLGNTVDCNVRRYTNNYNHYVEVAFSQNTNRDYKVIIVGNPNYSTVTITSS